MTVRADVKKLSFSSFNLESEVGYWLIIIQNSLKINQNDCKQKQAKIDFIQSLDILSFLKSFSVLNFRLLSLVYCLVLTRVFKFYGYFLYNEDSQPLGEIDLAFFYVFFLK